MLGHLWEKGDTRSVNEDSLTLQYVKTPFGNEVLAAVCDGIGGLSRGEIASRIVVEEINKWFYQEYLVKGLRWNVRLIRKSISRLFYRINQKLLDYARIEEQALGTTCTMILFHKQRIIYFHIGDSKGFRLRNRTTQFTKDHVMKKQILTKALGINKEWHMDYGTFYLRKGSAVLLCTDGFLDKFSPKELYRILLEEIKQDGSSIQIRLSEISRRGYDRGARDNMSAIYLLRR